MRVFLFIIAIMLSCHTSISQAINQKFDYTSFAELPIQDEGRVKPLDTFARFYLLSISGKSSMASMSAIEFLAELLFAQNKAYTRKVFNIPNQDVLNSIELQPSDDHHYSFLDLFPALQKHEGMIRTIYEKNSNELSLAQKQLVDVYMNVLKYYNLSRVFIVFPSQDLLQEFHIIPPQLKNNTDLWSSPAEIIHNSQGIKYLSYWKKMFKSYDEQNKDRWNNNTLKASQIAFKMIAGFSSRTLLKIEVLYNKLDLFTKALSLYIVSLLSLFIGLFVSNNMTRKISILTLVSGVVIQFVGIFIRTLIMHRPPVSTLYESILFASFISIIFAIILEFRRKDGMGLLIGAGIGSILLFIARKYALDGDTMGMLAAVLDTNFWLATHVVTITIGYGCCFVVGMLGHIYLIKYLLSPNNLDSHKTLQKNMVGIGLIALFFSMFGTILGGIWADQSWGRFWGWDPKENGAMLIVLWLILLLHGKIANAISPLTFAVGMAMTNIIVAIAWFGVNLLNVGLHSYGFTDNIALNLSVFCGLEFIFIMVMYFFARNHTKCIF